LRGCHSASHEISHVLCNLNFHYRVLNQTNPVHNFPHFSSKIRFNIILPSRPSVPIPSRYPTKSLYPFLISPIRAICPTHLTSDFITLIISGEEQKLLNTHHSMFSNLLLFPLRSRYSPQLPILRHPQSMFFP